MPKFNGKQYVLIASGKKRGAAGDWYAYYPAAEWVGMGPEERARIVAQQREAMRGATAASSGSASDGKAQGRNGDGDE